MRQQVVAGDRAIAQAFSEAGKLQEFPAGATVIQQGASDSDLFLILSGNLQISINGRSVATRGPDRHVGEMALIDPLACRSATVVASEPSTLLRITETKVVALAHQYPDVWRRFAVELANRLRERGRFLQAPHSQPVVFLGSSSEAKASMEYVRDWLSRKPCVPMAWTQGVFNLSSTAIEDLTRMTAEADLAAILLTEDDLTISRGRSMTSPRDNAVLELGLFIGALGRARTIALVPEKTDLKLPSDLLGVTFLKYRPGANRSLKTRLDPVCRVLYAAVKKLGPK